MSSPSPASPGSVVPDLLSLSSDRCAPVATWTESVAVTSAPVGGAPDAVTEFGTDPLFTSAWVIS